MMETMTSRMMSMIRLSPGSKITDDATVTYYSVIDSISAKVRVHESIISASEGNVVYCDKVRVHVSIQCVSEGNLDIF